MNPSIVIAGASGYIGKALIPKLLEKFPTAKITALSRSQQQSTDPRVEWKACDLFSLNAIQETLPAHIDVAYYLVHSMGPTAQLDQGNFADYDLILADNFAQVLALREVKQLIYLGGLLPETDKLSLHLQSRLEVEETFLQFKVPTTIFRAGLILGEAGSSFQILLKLVKRLPLMICPSWTQTLTTPVDLLSVLTALVDAALKPEHYNKIYDLAGCRPLTYVKMMQDTARQLGAKRLFLTVPFFTPTLSRLWVSLITNTPKDLVYPLIDSLQHKMVARETHQFSSDWHERSYFSLLDRASLKTHSGHSLFRFRARRKTVRSVQRMPLPPGRDAEFIRLEYQSWLPKALSPFVKVRTKQTLVEFALIHPRFVMLQLSESSGGNSKDRQILQITGGFLAGAKSRGRLEFGIVLNRRFAIAAIHDYRPTLPWFVYKFTQAIVHLLVMQAFARHLDRIAQAQELPIVATANPIALKKSNG